MYKHEILLLPQLGKVEEAYWNKLVRTSVASKFKIGFWKFIDGILIKIKVTRNLLSLDYLPL